MEENEEQEIVVLKPIEIMRDCLKCEGNFKALGKFNRLCPQCTNWNSKTYLDAEYTLARPLKRKKNE
jgi:Zn finger protein HypA/HybF involved in hydrogenase expression